jgi:3-carboxy-cis,cis-muconate cycloisomerase
MFAAMRPDHERATGPWHLEWGALPDACILTGGALHYAVDLLRDLRVRPDRMARNLALTDGLIVSEAVMMALAPAIGRQRAHDVVYRAAMTSVESGRPFEAVLRDEPEVTMHLNAHQLSRALTPTAYTGASSEFVDRVLTAVGLAPAAET